jgi:hypothetical protein
MSESDFEKRLHVRAKMLFRQQEQALDERTCAGLRAARERAVAAATAPRQSIGVGRLAWAVPVGAAAAMVLVGVLLLPESELAESPRATPSVAATDLQLLLAADDWALYEEFEFFAVLGALDDEEADLGSG